MTHLPSILSDASTLRLPLLPIDFFPRDLRLERLVTEYADAPPANTTRNTIVFTWTILTNVPNAPPSVRCCDKRVTK